MTSVGTVGAISAAPCLCFLTLGFWINMLKFLITFSLGIYTGIYLSQNYELPRVDDPSKIIEKIKEYADEHKKNK